MSKLARQLGLRRSHRRCGRRASCGPWNSRCGRRRPRRCRPLPRRRTTGADYDTEWARSKPARMARSDRRRPDAPRSRRPRIAGSPRRRPPARVRGAGDLRANHHSHLDTPLLLTSIPEPWRHKIVVGAAADYFFGTRITGAMSALGIGAIPIERAKTGRKSADLAAELIDGGWSLLIYPEGGRSPDGWGQPFRGGAAYLAARAGVPVVPVHVAGTGGSCARVARSPARATPR